MQRYHNASPLEILALFTLKLLNAGDIQPIALAWLERGLGGDEVACLAFEPCTSILENENSFKSALREILGDLSITKLEALWLTYRYYLQNVLYAQNDELNALHPVINLSYDADEMELFDRPDCDAHFAERNQKYPITKSTKFAGQEYGIENLWGLYYSTDDGYEWTKKIDQETKARIRDETRLVLERFYSTDSTLPTPLKRVQALIKKTA